MVQSNPSGSTFQLAVAVLLFFSLFAAPVFAGAHQTQSNAFGEPPADVEILYFYEAGCPSCVEIDDFLAERIEQNYPVIISRYEIHSPENANLLMRLVEACDAEEIREEGTPAIFVADKGFQGSSAETMDEIEEAVRSAVGSQKPSPLNHVSENGNETGSIKNRLTLPAVIGASAVDAVNPCAFGVLALLLGSMLVISKTAKRKNVIQAGLAFTAATFICYLLMGFGLFYAIRIAGLQRYIYFAVSILAILIGLWNTKDYFWYGVGANIEVPQSWRPRLKRITSGVTSVPSAFIIGCLVSVFLLPCTSGPYIVIIGMLSDTATRVQAVCLLLLYNFIFVIPFIIITLGVGFGLTTPARIEQWRQLKLKRLHLITGIFMVGLGVTMMTYLLLRKGFLG